MTDFGREPPDVRVAWRIRSDWGICTQIDAVARAALRAEGIRSGELSIAVVGARRMAALHQRYCGVPGATDVLTFDHGVSGGVGGRRRFDGEIVVCAQVARRRAGSVARARVELCLYVVHGVLHLCGYDDTTADGFDRMHRREDELLTKMGLGPAFSRAARPLGGRHA